MKNLMNRFIFPLVVIAILLGSIRLIPWDRVNWGKFEMLPGSAITVTGQAKQEGVGQRGTHLATEIALLSAVGFIHQYDNVIAAIHVRLSVTELVDHRDDDLTGVSF